MGLLAQHHLPTEEVEAEIRQAVSRLQASTVHLCPRALITVAAVTEAIAEMGEIVEMVETVENTTGIATLHQFKDDQHQLSTLLYGRHTNSTTKAQIFTVYRSQFSFYDTTHPPFTLSTPCN
jgi:hypothetical protein